MLCKSFLTELSLVAKWIQVFKVNFERGCFCPPLHFGIELPFPLELFLHVQLLDFPPLEQNPQIVSV